MLWYCENCGSTNVHAEEWRHINTGEHVCESGSDPYCGDCEQETRTTNNRRLAAAARLTHRRETEHEDFHTARGELSRRGCECLLGAKLAAIEKIRDRLADRCSRHRCPDCGMEGEQRGHMGCQYDDTPTPGEIMAEQEEAALLHRLDEARDEGELYPRR